MWLDGIEKAIKLLYIIAFVSVPLAIWKVIDIILWLFS